jgi:hypothetical protein
MLHQNTLVQRQFSLRRSAGTQLDVLDLWPVIGSPLSQTANLHPDGDHGRPMVGRRVFRHAVPEYVWRAVSRRFERNKN